MQNRAGHPASGVRRPGVAAHVAPPHAPSPATNVSLTLSLPLTLTLFLNLSTASVP